jgi:hypothetical protein
MSRLGVFILCSLLTGHSAFAGAEGIGTLQTIARDWNARREQTKAIRYDLTARRVWMRDSFNPTPRGVARALSEKFPTADIPNVLLTANPPTNVTGSSSCTMLLDLAHNRFRLEFDNEEYDNLSQQNYRIRCVEVGDGNCLRVRILENGSYASPKPGSKAHPDFWLARGAPQDIPAGILRTGFEPLFLAAGIVPSRQVYIRPTLLVPTNDLTAFSYSGIQMLNGRPHAVLTEGKKEYWIDLERDSAISRMTIKTGKHVDLTLEIEHKKAGGTWLPSTWIRKEYKSGKLSSSEEVEVKTIDPQPAVTVTKFVLQPSEGMFVHEEEYTSDLKTREVKAKSTYYRLEADGRKTKLTQSGEKYEARQ